MYENDKDSHFTVFVLHFFTGYEMVNFEIRKSHKSRKREVANYSLMAYI